MNLRQLSILFCCLALATQIGQARTPLFQNKDLSPKAVVTYFVERMTQGDYQLGLLDAEREAFTAWPGAPLFNDLWIATSYSIKEPRSVGLFGKFVKVRVEFKLKSVADVHGTFTPASESTHTVEFHLKRFGEAWKIVAPSANEWRPIVLESYFPYANY